MLRKEIEIPIYRGIFEICVSDSVDDINNLYCSGTNEPLFDKDEILYAFTFVTTHKNDSKNLQRFVIVFNEKNKVDKIDHTAIAHESFHITGYIMDTVGIKYDHDNDEPFAYMIGWISNEIYKFLKENKIKVL